MTDNDITERLARIRELEKEATPGPWEANTGDDCCWSIARSMIAPISDNWICENGDAAERGDALLICELRNSWPAIAEHIEKQCQTIRNLELGAVQQFHHISELESQLEQARAECKILDNMRPGPEWLADCVFTLQQIRALLIRPADKDETP